MARSPGNSFHCFLLTRLAALLFGSAVTSFPVHAEIVLEGPANALQIEMRDTSVQEVLLVLGANYGLRFSSQPRSTAASREVSMGLSLAWSHGCSTATTIS